MVSRSLFFVAVAATISLPNVARAQCVSYECLVYYGYVGAQAGMGLGRTSPGWFGAGRQVLAQSMGPARYPPSAVWRPYSPPAGYYAARPAPPGVWYPRR